MAYTPPNPNGSAVSASSAPVVLASDQLTLNVTGQSAQTAIVNNVLTATAGSAAIDCSGYQSGSVQVTSTATGGTYIFEGSNDNTTFVAIPVQNPLSGSGLPATAAIPATASTILYTFPINFRWLRLRIVSTLTAGSIQATLRLSMAPFTSLTQNVGQSTASSLNATIANLPGSGTPSDSLTLATAGVVENINLNYNGTSYDRVRNNYNGSTGDTGAKTATFNGATAVNYNAAGAIITCIVSAVSGTTPTMTLQLQWTPDGATWLNYGPATAALTAAGQVAMLVYPTQASDASSTTLAAFALGATQSKVINAPLPRNFRVVYTIGGTTPSFTITATYINFIN